MDPEATRATIVIALLALGSMGAAWGYDVLVGPPAPVGGTATPDEPLTLVGFRPAVKELSTGTLPFQGSGRVVFDPIPLDEANLTSVTVTIKVFMQGPSFGDTLSVVVETPAGDSITGEVQRAPNPNGYQVSEAVVQDWRLGEVPENVHYQTDDEATALRWAAENHTDRTHQGDWTSEVTLNPPTTPVRRANVSLTFQFHYYVAQAFPPAPEDGDPTRSAFDARRTTSRATTPGETAASEIQRLSQNLLDRGLRRADID